MLEMRLAMAVSGRFLGVGVHRIPVQVAFGIQPRYAVPFRVASCSQLLVVCLDVPLAIVGYGRELAVVLQLVLQLRQLRNNPFAFALRVRILGAVCRAMHVVNALSDDDGPSFAGRSMRERGRVAGVVLRCLM
jgi:hypothetical protein